MTGTDNVALAHSPEGTDMNDRWYRTNVTDAFADQVGQETAEGVLS